MVVKYTAVLVLSLFLMNFLSAQNAPLKKAGIGRITGKIVDSSTHASLEYATISIIPDGGQNAINGTTSTSSGDFTIDNLPFGKYKILVESIGYKPYSLNNITLSSGKPLENLKSIQLIKSVQALQAVVVTAQGKVLENKIDKMVFNAERDLTSQTGVATDVLRKVPQVSVDVDGNVQLAGSSSIRFLINGKPSTAFGSNISDVLQSIPASQIKSIEIITNPGAKYDAQGLGGIINIILKKNNAQGVNGNLSLTAGTRADNGSFNFTARKGTIGFNAFISGNARPTVATPFTYDRRSTDSLNNTTLLHQDGTTRVNRAGFQSGLGFDWSPNEKNSLSGSLAYNHFENHNNGAINQEQTTYSPSGIPTATNRSLNQVNNAFQFHNVDAGLNYKRTFDKEDQELELSVNTSFGHNLATANNNDYLMPQDSLYFSTRSTNPGTERETEVQADYTQPLKKDVLLGIGSKLNFRDISSSADVLRYEGYGKIYQTDPYLSNSLDYHQQVYAFYSELTFPLGKILDAKVGGRYERTQIDAFFSNAQHQSSFPGYNTFVPSVFLSKKLSDQETIKFSYSKRIERPDYRDLNPFINTSDPKNLSAGNPYLQPEIGNRFELGFQQELSKAGSFFLNLFYRTSNHDIQPYIVYYPSLKVGDSTYTNVSLSTRENIGMEKDAGVNLFLDLHFFNKLNVRTNFFVFHRNTLNALDPGYNATSFNYRSNLNASYLFTTNLAAEIFGNFNSARHEVQGTYPSFTSYSIAIRQQLWKKKASIALTTINPFSEYVTQTSELFGPHFTTIQTRKIPFRSFGINVTYKFGKLEFKKPKENNNENLNLPTE